MLIRRTLVAAALLAAPIALAAPAMAEPDTTVRAQTGSDVRSAPARVPFSGQQVAATDSDDETTKGPWETALTNSPWENIWPADETPGVWENAFSKGQWETAFSGPWETVFGDGDNPAGQPGLVSKVLGGLG